MLDPMVFVIDHLARVDIFPDGVLDESVLSEGEGEVGCQRTRTAASDMNSNVGVETVAPVECGDSAPAALGPDRLTDAIGEMPLDAVISAHIRRVLERAGGKIHGPGGAGELLGVNPNTLRSKMRKFGIPFGR